ncbi:MAG TPA: hypothetical protein VKV26_12645 [Dehalococcoidia bacterium]|nr:hypothetical protein [Dehalococcoidia bacterium]
MGRTRLALLAIAALAIFAAAQTRAQHALAVTYAPGWNLVSGPEGSHLVGAEGDIFTMQPGDADYEAFPADTPLSGGFGYWAYFPQGGSLEATIGVAEYSVTLVPGQWTLVGNPNSKASVTLSGDFTALIFVPEDGYVSVSSIPVGAGAWVLGAGQLTLSAPAGAVPVVKPLSVTAFVDPVETTTSYLAPGTLVLQIDVQRNGLPVQGATVSGSVAVGGDASSMSFGPDVLRGQTGERLRFPTPALPIGTQVLIHVDATLDGVSASTDTFFAVTSTGR